MKATYDPDGRFVAAVSDGYAQRALARSEVTEVDSVLVVIPQPTRRLSPQERRRAHLRRSHR